MSVGTEDRTVTINGRPVPLVSLTTSSDWLSLIICQVLLWVQLWLSRMQKVFAILKASMLKDFYQGRQLRIGGVWRH